MAKKQTNTINEAAEAVWEMKADIQQIRSCLNYVYGRFKLQPQFAHTSVRMPTQPSLLFFPDQVYYYCIMF